VWRRRAVVGAWTGSAGVDLLLGNVTSAEGRRTSQPPGSTGSMPPRRPAGGTEPTHRHRPGHPADRQILHNIAARARHSSAGDGASGGVTPAVASSRVLHASDELGTARGALLSTKQVGILATGGLMPARTPTTLNNVDLGAVVGLVTAIQEQPGAAATTWTAEVRWNGGFQSDALIRDFAPLRSDEPRALGGSDTAPNPVEQLLGALGNCLAVGYAANASVAGIAIRDLRIELSGNIDLHAFLGLRDGHAGFDDIHVAVHLDADAPDDQLVALHDKVVGSSPVGHTLTRAVPVTIELV
jgi:uncharacterized OsmC-like protein